MIYNQIQFYQLEMNTSQLLLVPQFVVNVTLIQCHIIKDYNITIITKLFKNFFTLGLGY